MQICIAKQKEILENGKYQFSNSTKTFVNENLTGNHSCYIYLIRIHAIRNGLIPATYARDGVVHLKHSKHSGAFKIFRIDKLYEIFPDFFFDKHEGLFHDVSQDANSTTQSR